MQHAYKYRMNFDLSKNKINQLKNDAASKLNLSSYKQNETKIDFTKTFIVICSK